MMTEASLIGSDPREANFPVPLLPQEWEEAIYRNLYEHKRYDPRHKKDTR